MQYLVGALGVNVWEALGEGFTVDIFQHNRITFI